MEAERKSNFVFAYQQDIIGSVKVFSIICWKTISEIGYDLSEELVSESGWYNGNECNTKVDDEGIGSKSMNTCRKHLKLNDNYVLVDLACDLFYNTKATGIGNDCFKSAQTFQIDGLNRLKLSKTEVVYSLNVNM